MAHETPFLKVPLKGELLKKTAQRFPELESSAIEAITMLQAVSTGVKAQMNCTLEGYGLSEGRFYVLCYLFTEELMEHNAPGPSDIAEHLGVTRATITGLLDGLERDGFLERLHHSRDRRALTIQMTDKGRQTLDEFMPTAVRHANAVMAVLDESERETLIGLLGKVEAHLEQLEN
jgi:DNA-binding MarR family transcriptional regulator